MPDSRTWPASHDIGSGGVSDKTDTAREFSVAGFLEFAHWINATAEGSPIVCAVLGRPVAHSLSPIIHRSAAAALPAAADFHYVRVDAGEEGELRRLINESPACVRGFSVTMPGKVHARTVADEVSARAIAIGSANTLVSHRVSQGGPSDGADEQSTSGDPTPRRWRADNTDVTGLSVCLDSVLGDQQATHAAVVGNGGTARPAVAALAAHGTRYVEVVARSERALVLKDLVESYGMNFSWTRLGAPTLATICQRSDVLISTVPESAAGEYSSELSQAGAVIDVIYNPYPTRLLTAARAAKRPTADGLLMLAGQGAEQFQQFTGSSASVRTMYQALQAHGGLDTSE